MLDPLACLRCSGVRCAACLSFLLCECIMTSLSFSLIRLSMKIALMAGIGCFDEGTKL